MKIVGLDDHDSCHDYFTDPEWADDYALLDVRAVFDADPAVAHVKLTCIAAPTQFCGQTADGSWFYYRERHHRTMLAVAATHGAAIGDALDGARDGAPGTSFRDREYPTVHESAAACVSMLHEALATMVAADE